MIRPVTLFCWMLVLGSGLYLYRAKHDVELLDKRIAQVARETEAFRGESRRLLDEWIRLGEPEQLRKYSDQYLGLRTVAPTQFVRVADLAGKLPAPRQPPTEEEALAPPSAEAPVMEEAEAEDLPIPPVPPEARATIVMPAASPREPEVTRILSPRPVTVRTAEAPRPAEPRVAPDSRVAEEQRPAPPKSVIARPAEAPRPTEPRIAEESRPAPRPVAARPAEPRPVETRPAEPRVQTAQRPAYAPPAPLAPIAAATPPPSWSPPRPASGSMLGAARGQASVPLPTPVSAAWPSR